MQVVCARDQRQMGHIYNNPHYIKQTGRKTESKKTCYIAHNMDKITFIVSGSVGSSESRQVSYVLFLASPCGSRALLERRGRGEVTSTFTCLKVCYHPEDAHRHNSCESQDEQSAPTLLQE